MKTVKFLTVIGHDFYTSIPSDQSRDDYAREVHGRFAVDVTYSPRGAERMTLFTRHIVALKIDGEA